MTTQDYLAALATLELPPHGKATGDALGLKPRQLARLAAGQPVTPMLAKLLAMYLRHGLPGVPAPAPDVRSHPAAHSP